MAIPISKRRQAAQGSHARAPHQEAGLAESLGGRVTKGSGNQSEKGDVRVKGLVRVECKNTIHASYSVGIEEVVKLEKMAATSEEIPFMQVDLQVINGKARAQFCVIPHMYLDYCLNVMRENEILKAQLKECVCHLETD